MRNATSDSSPSRNLRSFISNVPPSIPFFYAYKKSSCLIVLFLVSVFLLLPQLLFARRNTIKVAVMLVSSRGMTFSLREQTTHEIESEFQRIDLFHLLDKEAAYRELHVPAKRFTCGNMALRSLLKSRYHVDFLVCGTISQSLGKYIIKLELLELDTNRSVATVKQGCRSCSVEQVNKSMYQVARALLRKYFRKHRKNILSYYPEYNIDLALNKLRSSSPRTTTRASKTGETAKKATPQRSPTIKGTRKTSSNSAPISEPTAQLLPQTGITAGALSSESASKSSKGKDGSVAIFDYEKVKEKYSSRREQVIIVLMILLFFIAAGIVTLNIYRRKRYEVRSSSVVVTLAELEQSDHPQGMLRCTVKRGDKQHETYIYAPSTVVVGYDPTEGDAYGKPHLNISLLPEIGDNVTRSRAVDRRHGKFDFNQDMLYYTDLGSQNGSVINGNSCEPGEAYELKDQDIVGLAGIHQLQVTLEKNEEGNIAVIFLTRLDPGAAMVMYMLLIQSCYFTLGQEYNLEWTGTEKEDSLVRFFFRNGKFRIQSMIDYPPILYDGERLSEGSRRRINKLHSTLELQNIHILIDDLTATL